MNIIEKIKSIKSRIKLTRPRNYNVKDLWQGGIGTDTPGIDIWEMRENEFVYGYWENRNIAGPDNPPSIKVSIPIIKGGFEYEPDVNKFMEWLVSCVSNPQDLNKKTYNQKFKREE